MELVGNDEHYGLIVDLSAEGLRLQRPYFGRCDGRIVQLEFELPEVDEIIWAKGLICFDQLWRAPGPHRPPQRLVRTSGVRILAAATRHLRMMREYVEAQAERQRRSRRFVPRLEALALPWT
jgi:hypothetical protein